MRRALTLHPNSHCAATIRIEAGAERPRPDRLVLTYAVSGAIGGLRLPPATTPWRADGLWRHTCFEAFVRAGHGTPYYEFNFSPATKWAAYRFDDYRTGMGAAAGIGVPPFEVRWDAGRLQLQAMLALERLPDLPGDADWRLGLSAVIEDRAGGLSYWALAHAPGRPDFHHSDCFALELAPACQA